MGETKIEQILAICDTTLEGIEPQQDALMALQGEVYDELCTDEKLGFITVEERDLAFAAWCKQYANQRAQA